MSKPDNYKNINDSFETGFENIGNKELVHRNKGLNSDYGRQDISLEMNRRLIDEIEKFNKNSSKQSEIMIKLTWGIIGLTILLTFLTIVNLWILF